MRLLNSIVILALGFTTFATALPYESITGDDLDLTLPESGQIVFTPLEFGDDGSFDYESFEGDNVSSAIIEDWKALVVRTHNEYRRKYGAGPVSWSDALYPGTAQWAGQCKFQHRYVPISYGTHPWR